MSLDIFPHVIRLYNRLTDARATLMDNLANITASRMNNLDSPVSLTAKSTEVTKSSVWTSSKAAFLDKRVSLVGIKSVQHVNGTTLSYSSASTTATITAVDTSKSVIHHTWSGQDGTSCRVSFASSTSVEIAHSTSGSGTGSKVVNLTVVEYYT